MVEHKCESRLDRLEMRVSKIDENVSGLKDTIHEGFQDLSQALTSIATVALNKNHGFSGMDVLKLLGGVGIFILALMYGLEKLGILKVLVSS